MNLKKLTFASIATLVVCGLVLLLTAGFDEPNLENRVGIDDHNQEPVIAEDSSSEHPSNSIPRTTAEPTDGSPSTPALLRVTQFPIDELCFDFRSYALGIGGCEYIEITAETVVGEHQVNIEDGDSEQVEISFSNWQPYEKSIVFSANAKRIETKSSKPIFEVCFPIGRLELVMNCNRPDLITESDVDLNSSYLATLPTYSDFRDAANKEYTRLESTRVFQLYPGHIEVSYDVGVSEDWDSEEQTPDERMAVFPSCQDRTVTTKASETTKVVFTCLVKKLWVPVVFSDPLLKIAGVEASDYETDDGIGLTISTNPEDESSSPSYDSLYSLKLSQDKPSYLSSSSWSHSLGWWWHTNGQLYVKMPILDPDIIKVYEYPAYVKFSNGTGVFIKPKGFSVHSEYIPVVVDAFQTPCNLYLSAPKGTNGFPDIKLSVSMSLTVYSGEDGGWQWTMKISGDPKAAITLPCIPKGSHAFLRKLYFSYDGDYNAEASKVCRNWGLGRWLASGKRTEEDVKNRTLISGKTHLIKLARIR